MNRGATAAHHRINKPQWSHAVILVVIRLKKPMLRLPADLQERISEQYCDEETRLAMSNSLDKLWDGGINVGAPQLARAIIFLANGDLEKFWKLRNTFLGDPRDLLCEANAHLIHSEYWFTQPLSEMGELKIPLD